MLFPIVHVGTGSILVLCTEYQLSVKLVKCDGRSWHLSAVERGCALVFSILLVRDFPSGLL